MLERGVAPLRDAPDSRTMEVPMAVPPTPSVLQDRNRRIVRTCSI